MMDVIHTILFYNKGDNVKMQKSDINILRGYISTFFSCSIIFDNQSSIATDLKCLHSLQIG